MFRSIIVGAGLTAATLATMVPATAQVSRFDPALKPLASQTIEVQYRRYPYRGGYYRGGRGFPVGAGIAAGVVAGALLGGALSAAGRPAYAAEPVYGGGAQADAVDYCASRFRSYDPSSGTYVGYDGVRRSCP